MQQTGWVRGGDEIGVSPNQHSSCQREEGAERQQKVPEKGVACPEQVRLPEGCKFVTRSSVSTSYSEPHLGYDFMTQVDPNVQPPAGLERRLWASKKRIPSEVKELVNPSNTYSRVFQGLYSTWLPARDDALRVLRRGHRLLEKST
eukprot:767417-Hanusia_phi.AAC.3